MAEQKSNITQNQVIPRAGIDMDSNVSQIPQGKLSYALNATVDSFDSSATTYQNEQGNTFCCEFPEGYKYIGGKYLPEISKHIFMLCNPTTGDSEIGYMDNSDCEYKTYINDPCLNFNINYPIHKIVTKITNCSTEIYWTDNFNPRRFLDLNKIPYITTVGDTICDVTTSKRIDCNKLKVQPNFDIPQIDIVDVISGGENKAGTLQFAANYCDVAGDAYTSFFSVTNPLPLFDENVVTLNFDFPVGKSVVLNISNIDVTGYFQYFNLAVIKTINNISSVEIVGTYTIDSKEKTIIYSGQNQTQIKLTINDIFEKYPYYDTANDVTNVQDIIVWEGLKSLDQINYQQIASQIKLYWQSYRIPATEDYSNELNAANLRGYLRDEVYPFEIVFLLKNGQQTDGFHIPGRSANPSDIFEIPSTNEDFIGEPDPTTGGLPTWKIYNTATVIETDSAYTTNPSYKGIYQYGEFAYWESEETYPCNDALYGELSGKPIRHHKFPDCLVSPHFESSTYTPGTVVTPVMENRAVFPIGVRLDINQVNSLIATSNLTQEQKDNIVGFKIVRGDRSTNKSVIAKGILRNVGKYTREGTEYYFPNYPYNDLREDPFLLEQSNAYNSECGTYEFTPTTGGTYQYTDCFTGKEVTGDCETGVLTTICSLTVPTNNTATIGTVTKVDYDSYLITNNNSALDIYINYNNPNGDSSTLLVKHKSSKVINVESGFTPSNPVLVITKIEAGKNVDCYPSQLNAFSTDASKYRQVFNSPETSFGQPFLGSILKLENVIFGGGRGHFVEVKNNANYKLITKEAQEDALRSSYDIANISSTLNETALFTAYQSYLEIYLNGITRKNYGYSYNSIAQYNYYGDINNGLGIKQRELDVSQYLISGVQSINDTININNFQRESSIYLKTDETKRALPYPNLTKSLQITPTTSIIEDKSRYVSSQQSCSSPESEFDLSVVSYYGSIKNPTLSQWGQLYSYETIDTGFQAIIDTEDFLNGQPTIVTIFGGDTFINKFSFKTKLPFFIDNRVNAPDDSDIFYDEIGNVAYPEYWHSARSILYDYKYETSPDKYLKNIISIKAHYLDCPNSQLPAPDPNGTPPIINPNRTFYDGKMYMFAYGIPTFYVESSINVDLRQAFNSREGEFYPHVSTGIPDNWLQQINVPIAQDNTYYYNVTYSKQNKENFFSHLPVNWTEDQCFTNYPFRAIFSDPQQSYTDNRINSWLLYRPASFFDFPQNYGNLTAVDGIDNRQVLARFENKSLLYNALYTTQTNTGGQVYLGQSLFSSNVPPLDFAETDAGYVGSQNKFLLKIPQGQITVDAKRGQVFLISSQGINDLSRLGSGLNKFFTDHLQFEILNYFPNVPIDNHFNGFGLHGIYDSKFDRVLISKIDYIPLSDTVKYDDVNNQFYIINENTELRENLELEDSTYFCNRSWTLSFNLNTNSWISFHSYIPNYYIAENNFFYSGINTSCDIEAIAAEIVAYTTTTTTTFPPGECNIEGTAYLVQCNIEGIAFGTTSTTTSTSSTSTTTTTTTTPP